MFSYFSIYFKNMNSKMFAFTYIWTSKSRNNFFSFYISNISSKTNNSALPKFSFFKKINLFLIFSIRNWPSIFSIIS